MRHREHFLVGRTLKQTDPSCTDVSSHGMSTMVREFTYPPEFTPTERSETMASSVSSFLPILSSPFAFRTARALAHTKAALLDNPPPAGTVPSAKISILTGVYFPCFW